MMAMRDDRNALLVSATLALVSRPVGRPKGSVVA